MRVLGKWWDKAALALSVVLCVAALIGSAQPRDRAELVRDSVRMTRILENDLRARSGDPVPGAIPVSLARAFGPVPDPALGELWIYQARPRFAVGVAAAAAPAGAVISDKKVFRLDRPVVTGIVAETGLVRLIWDAPQETTVRVSGYHIYRRRSGDRELVRVTPEPVKDRIFADETVPPRQDLEYAVAAVTDEPDAVKALGLGPSAEGPRSEMKPVRTLGTYALSLRIVSRFPPEREGGEPLMLARVTVRKFVEGAWLEKDYSVRKGDRIGRPETVSRGGRPVAVDFATGFEVLSIEPAKAIRADKVVRPTFDPKTAKKVGEEEVTIAREVPSWKLVYRDDTGATIALMPEEGRAPSPAVTRPDKDNNVR